MGKKISIQVEGLDAIRKKFKMIPVDLAEEVDTELHAAALDFETKAANAAPVDLGLLRNAVKSQRIGTMHYEIVSGAPYSAYVEFGTISRVSVPTDLVEFAAQFKGKGLRKTGGIFPKPFFFKQRGPVMDALMKKLNPAIKKALSK